MKIFTINPSIYSQIKEHLTSSQPRKIAAIKALRKETSSGLKEAKDAIEKLQHDQFGGHYPNASKEGHQIIVGPLIKRVVVDYGDGEIEVDLESMELRALMEMQSIGLDACAEILDLVEALKAYAKGAKIGVINGSR